MTDTQDPHGEMLAVIERQAERLDEQARLLASMADLLERGNEAIERAAAQEQAFRRLVRFVFAEPSPPTDLAFWVAKFGQAN